jgi:amino acid adenylation domain-containing protein
MIKNLADHFIHIATHYPDKPAILFHENKITYEELHQRSNEVAQHLLNINAKSEEIIPLIMERDADTMIVIIGILKAGCAFLPISPITPCSRVRFILDDTKARFVISNKEIAHFITTDITHIRPSDIKPSDSSITTITAPSHLAYVMYTSGSTGNPKGVLIHHSSMMNLFLSIIENLNLSDKEVILALTDYTFDISLIELLMPLLIGATIVLTEQGTVADGAKIKQYLQHNKVTLMQATPLTWEILLKQGWKNKGSMKILVGGEKFRTKLAQMLEYKKGNIWNMYGPTETSMWSMFYQLKDPLVTETVPLGYPLHNTLIEILDENLNNVDVGGQGELYIGGEGLARGYLNNAALTEKQFIIHPQTKTRLYKTGDLVTLFDEKTLCYMGRTDDQLKFGGIRIEAGEIESVIEQEPFVKKAVVKVHETETYYKSLAAYIEIDEESLFASGIHSTNNDVSHFLKNIYDETYLYAEEHEHGSINNCGWQSSFTGQLFGVEELDESYQFVRSNIKTADLTNVLEAGCGTGSLLMGYIDKAKACTIVEISSKAIDYVKQKLSPKQLQRITFKNDSILTIHDHLKYSCIIVNSVIQYLPSINALITTIRQLVTAAQDNGTIIIGDVRSLELLDIYLLEKIRTNSNDTDELTSNLNAFYYKSRDAEIVLSPKLFHALKNSIAGISHVDICVKHGNYKNELNYFRYDVVLHISKTIVYQAPITIQYSPSLTENSINDLIKTNVAKPLYVHNIPNIAILDFLNTIEREIPNQLASININKPDIYKGDTSLHFSTLLNLKIKSHDLFVVYGEENPIDTLDLHFYPKGSNPIIRGNEEKVQNGYRAWCREPFNPWLQKFCFDHIKLKVSQHVVSWVNPSTYIWIEKWPVSINGKLDKKKLKLPIYPDNDSTDASVIEQLQIMWRNITGDNAVIDKEFWIHGVSSLCMYFFLATINETFLVNINYHEFHDYNTLEKLANYIAQLLDHPNPHLRETKG